jgi:hypothetical protein
VLGLVKSSRSGEVELSARAGRCGPWGGLGGQPEMREDLTHDDGVGELCDEAARAVAMRAGEGVDGALGHDEIAPSGGGRGCSAPSRNYVTRWR